MPTERLLAAIVESSDDAIIGKTLDGVITSWNPAAERLYGYTAAEAIGRPISLIIPLDRPEELPSIMGRLRRGEPIDHFETVRVRKDGERLDISVSISPIRDEAGAIIGAASIGRDITGQRHSERERQELARQADLEMAARHESEERFRAVWTVTAEAIAISDPEGIVLDANPAYCALYGRSADEVVGQSFSVIFPVELRDAAEAQYRAIFAAAGAPSVFEARIHLPDGSERVVESRANFLEREGKRLAMVSTIHDITERKRLDEAQQDFVAMASHDLASPLTVLRARAQLLQRRQTYDEASVAAILEQTGRMGRLISDLRDLAQAEGGGLAVQRQPVDLVALGQEAVERASTLTTTHRVTLTNPESTVLVAGDRDRLAQVLDNLLGNAIKYSPDGGDIRVYVAACGATATLRVTDEGPGIPAETLPRLFDRFFRGTRASGDPGLGLGLYITRMVVEAHGGHVRAESEPGEGSTFTVELPLLP
ncbi:MAG: PAS domain S-box protein [Thermomicrobiales bacterium]